MAKGEFDMFYLCAGVGWRGTMIFSSDKSMTLEGGQKKIACNDQGGGFQKMKGKNKEIIIGQVRLDKL